MEWKTYSLLRRILSDVSAFELDTGGSLTQDRVVGIGVVLALMRHVAGRGQ